jgi:hypothetical protein
VQQHSNAVADDEDWVKLPGVPGYVYTIRTYGLMGVNDDTVLDLYGPDGVTLLAHNDDDPVDGGPGSRIDYVFPSSDTYYAREMQVRPDEVFGCETVYYMQVTRSELTPTPTATASPTPTVSATATATATATPGPTYDIYLPVIVTAP